MAPLSLSFSLSISQSPFNYEPYDFTTGRRKCKLKKQTISNVLLSARESFANPWLDKETIQGTSLLCLSLYRRWTIFMCYFFLTARIQHIMYSNVLYFEILYRSVDRGLTREIDNILGIVLVFFIDIFFSFLCIFLSFSVLHRIHITPTSFRHVYLYIVYHIQWKVYIKIN